MNEITKLSSEVKEEICIARKAKILSQAIDLYQTSASSIELCSKPVIAAIHGGCLGAGVDFITATDIRCCTKNTYFQSKEVDMAIAADAGTLQRLPKIINSESLIRDFCFTARKLAADEALACGLVTQVYTDKERYFFI